MQGSHYRLLPGAVHIYRAVFPTMLSMWRLRERFGVAKRVTFSQFLREPWASLPKTSKSACESAHGVDAAIAPPRLEAETALDRYVAALQLFRDAPVQISYYKATTKPRETVRYIAGALGATMRLSFTPVLERVGYWPATEDTPDIQGQDWDAMELVSRELRCLYEL